MTEEKLRELCCEALGDQITDGVKVGKVVETEMLFLFAIAELFRAENVYTDTAIALRKELNYLDEHNKFSFDA